MARSLRSQLIGDVAFSYLNNRGGSVYLLLDFFSHLGFDLGFLLGFLMGDLLGFFLGFFFDFFNRLNVVGGGLLGTLAVQLLGFRV